MGLKGLQYSDILDNQLVNIKFIFRIQLGQNNTVYGHLIQNLQKSNILF